MSAVARTRLQETQIVAEVGSRVKLARRAANLTLEELAARSTVSRAMLSKVERGEKSPTLGVLIAIARGLGKTVSELMGAVPSQQSVEIIRKSERVTFIDAQSGFVRYLLSPTHPDHQVEMVLHVLPPGVGTGELPVYAFPTGKYLVVNTGRLTACIGECSYVLEAGNSMYFDLKTPYRFVNEGDTECAYYMTSVRQG